MKNLSPVGLTLGQRPERENSGFRRRPDISYRAVSNAQHVGRQAQRFNVFELRPSGHRSLEKHKTLHLICFDNPGFGLENEICGSKSTRVSLMPP